MSQLTDFYAAISTDSCGRMIDTIWAEDNDYWEYEHSYIQWIFPLKEPSNFNPDAPLLTDEDIVIFKTDPQIQSNLITSFCRFLTFLGLAYHQEKVVATELFEPILFKMANHNWFRITRVLKSLRLVGFEEEAIGFFKFLKEIHEENGWVSDNSFSYWKEAVNGLVAL